MPQEFVCSDCGILQKLRRVGVYRGSGRCNRCASRRRKEANTGDRRIVTCPGCGVEREQSKKYRDARKSARCPKCRDGGPRKIDVTCPDCGLVRKIYVSYLRQRKSHRCRPCADRHRWSTYKSAKIDVICPDCGLVRTMQKSTRSRCKSDRCSVCAIRNFHQKRPSKLLLVACPDCGRERIMSPSRFRNLAHGGRCHGCASVVAGMKTRKKKSSVVCPDCGYTRACASYKIEEMSCGGRCQKCAARFSGQRFRVQRVSLICSVCASATPVFPSYIKVIKNPELWVCPPCRTVVSTCPDCGITRERKRSAHIRCGLRCRPCATRLANTKTKLCSSSISSPEEFLSTLAKAVKGDVP